MVEVLCAGSLGALLRSRVQLLALALLGCTSRPPPAPPPILLGPVTPLLTPPAPPAPPLAGPYAAAVVVRDTNALIRQAARYVSRRDSDPAVNRQLTTLKVQVGSAVERMERARNRKGYRPSDVVAARVAADALAAFLAVQAKPLAPAAEPAQLRSNRAPNEFPLGNSLRSQRVPDAVPDEPP